MPQIIIQNLPSTGFRGTKTQYGGNFVHIHGTGTTIRQAAYDALALMPANLFDKWNRLLGRMIPDLRDNGTKGDYEIRISIPCEIGPRQYANGKIHPGKPDVIDHHYTIAHADKHGVYYFPADSATAIIPTLPTPAKRGPGRPRKAA